MIRLSCTSLLKTKADTFFERKILSFSSTLSPFTQSWLRACQQFLANRTYRQTTDFAPQCGLI